jgi:hypothetical protein
MSDKTNVRWVNGCKIRSGAFFGICDNLAEMKGRGGEGEEESVARRKDL